VVPEAPLEQTEHGLLPAGELGLGFTVLEPGETMAMYDADVGYARFPERVNTGYHDGWLRSGPWSSA
jgi:hypothetical protein